MQRPDPGRSDPLGNEDDPADSSGFSQAEQAEVDKMLQTPYGQVYELSEDLETYKLPCDLEGTPTKKLTESGPYWENGWTSLDKFLEREAEEERLKEEYHSKRVLNPNDKKIAKVHKRHADNVSKHRKIREIFGPDSAYHPNQLVAKEHLPLGGLVEMDVMYKMACKITDLQVLKDRGKLSMEPWDFLRWRIIKKARERCAMPWHKLKDAIKPVTLRISDDSGLDGADRYEDNLLRKAILLSATYQRTVNRYGVKTVHMPSRSFCGPAVPRGRSSSSSFPPPPLNSAPDRASSATREQRDRQRNEVVRREQRSILNRPPTYQGVNAYRAQREQQRQEQQRQQQQNQEQQQQRQDQGQQH